MHELSLRFWVFVGTAIGFFVIMIILLVTEERHYRRYAKWRMLEILRDGNRFVEEFRVIDPRISRRDAPVHRYLAKLQEDDLVYYEPVPVTDPSDPPWHTVRTLWKISESGREMLRSHAECLPLVTS